MIKSMKKYYNKTKKKFDLWFIMMGLILANIFFFTGFHAVDLCRNELFIEHSINELLEEKNLTFQYHISETTASGNVYAIANGECHKQGITLMFFGFAVMIGLWLLFVMENYAKK